MPYEAKTDWKYDDTVTEKDLNRIEQGLKDAHVAEREALTLSPGVQVVEVENDTPFNFGEVKGRTLINMLGSMGKGDSATHWLGTGATVATTSDSLKVTALSAPENPEHFAGHKTVEFLPVKGGAFYVVIGHVHAESGGEAYIRPIEFSADAVTSDYGAVVPKVEAGKKAYTVFSFRSKAETNSLVVRLQTCPDSVANFKHVAIYEISEAEYNTIQSMTAEQVAARYPYVDAMINVCNPYAIVTGANFLPPFTDWDLRTTDTINGPYKLSKTVTAQYQATISPKIRVIRGQTYTLSSSRYGRMVLGEYKEDGTVIGYPIAETTDGDGFFSQSVTIGATTDYIIVQLSNIATSGTFSFENTILVPGTEPKPFTPQQRSIWAAECDLAANPVDGSNPDVLFAGDDGLPYVLEKWKKVALDGSLPWMHDASFTGHKRVRIIQYVPGGVASNPQFMTKYNGTTLKHDNTNDKPDCFDLQPSTGYLYLTIPNSDSGWGPDYTPDTDEIKAYFLGWKMYKSISSENPNIDSKSPLYNGEVGLKTWGKIWNGTGTNNNGVVDGTGGVRTVPPTSYAEWTPYRLQYLKAKSTVEPVRNYETGATLCKGANMVEVGSGIVIREKANPYGNYINAINAPGGRLQHRTTRLLAVYRNQTRDLGWTFKDGVWNGEPYQYAENPIPEVDAVYHVTYTMLDQTLAAPINGIVAANLRGTVSDLVQDVGDVQRRLSVVENSKAEAVEDTGWIPVTPINGWTTFAAIPLRFRVIGNRLLLRGAIQGGSSGKLLQLFVLPIKAPGYNSYFGVVTWGGGTVATANCLLSSGAVFLNTGTAGTYLSFDGLELLIDGLEVKKS